MGSASGPVLLKIGAFAHRAAVSLKTLRHYDRVGLLRPAYVDARTGYRYYDLRQLTRLRHIRLLRGLGCGIEEIRAWSDRLDSVAECAVVLQAVRDRLQGRIAEDLVRLAALERWIELAGNPAHAVCRLIPTERALPAVAALTIRDRVNSSGPAVYRMFEAAERRAAREGMRGVQNPFLLFHRGDYRSPRIDVEVCVPVVGAALGAPGTRMVAGSARALCGFFSGSYDQAAAVYEVIRAWADLTGACSNGPLRETYLRFGADQRGYSIPARQLARRVEDYQTELQLPLG